jgi:pyruvate dehydrogenase E2 component (dihydrolipoamide acetyltransferase)
MLVDIIMPFLAETMEDGTVLKWLKAVGDAIKVGEDLVEIETDKVTTTYESDTAGVMKEIVVSKGTTVPCGTVIARIETGGPVAARDAT